MKLRLEFCLQIYKKSTHSANLRFFLILLALKISANGLPLQRVLPINYGYYERDEQKTACGV